MRYGAWFACLACGAALAAGVKSVEVKKLAGPIALDGKLDEAAWKRPPDIHDFVSIEKSAAPAKFQTAAWLGYDDDNFYLAIKCDVPDEKNIPAKGKVRDMDISSDDCVEIFLDHDHDRDTYYHLMINSIGTQYDAACGKEGTEWNFAWNALWDARTSLGEKCWYAEVQIPFSSLDITPKVTSTWALSVGRERSGEVTYWAGSGGFHKPKEFADIEGIQADFEPFCISVSEVEAGGCVSAMEELGAVTRARLVAEGRGEKNVKIAVDLGKTGTPSGEAEARLAPGKGTDVFVPGKAVPAGKTDCLLSITDRATGRLLHTAWRQVTFDPCPVRTQIVAPAYRRTIYASEAEKRIAVWAYVNNGLSVPAGTRLAAALTCRSKTIREKQFDVPGPEGILVVFDLANQPDGTYELLLDVLSKSGKRFACSALEFQKLPPSPAEVRLGPNGEFVVAGQPFFPIFLFGVDSGHGGMKVYEEVTKAGFNSSLYVGAHQAHDANKSGFKLMPHFDPKFQNDPAILGWYYQEEHDIQTKTDPQEFVKGYHQLWRTDPYHPVLSLCFNSGAFSGIYGDTADVYVIEPYLYLQYSSDKKDCEEKMKRYISWIQTTVASARMQTAKLGSTKSVIVGAQGWDSRAWNCRFNPVKARDDRPISLVEERASAYLAVVHGANGMGWYNYMVDYWNMHMNPLFWEALRGIAQEMQWLTPVFFGKTVEGIECDNPAIQLIGKRVGEETYVLAVNTKLDRSAAKIALPKSLGVKRLHVLSEGRSLKVKNGAFEDTFIGFATHIYTTRKDLPSLPIAKMLRDKDFLTAPRKELKSGNLASEQAGAKIASSFRMLNVPHFMFANDDNVHSCWMTREWFEGWQNKPKEPDWLEITFPKKQRVGKVVIRSWLPKYMDDPVRVLSDFELQYAAATGWRTIKSVEGNKSEVVTVKLAPPTDTEKIRLIAKKGVYVAEIEAYP